MSVHFKGCFCQIFSSYHDIMSWPTEYATAAAYAKIAHTKEAETLKYANCTILLISSKIIWIKLFRASNVLDMHTFMIVLSLRSTNLMKNITRI